MNYSFISFKEKGLFLAPFFQFREKGGTDNFAATLTIGGVFHPTFSVCHVLPEPDQYDENLPSPPLC